MYIKALSSSSNILASIYNRSNQIWAASSSPVGLTTANRNSLTSFTLYKDGVARYLSGSPGGTVVNANIYFMGANSGGSAADTSTRQYTFFCVGKGISDSSIDDFNADVSSLLSKI